MQALAVSIHGIVCIELTTVLLVLHEVWQACVVWLALLL